MGFKLSIAIIYNEWRLTGEGIKCSFHSHCLTPQKKNIIFRGHFYNLFPAWLWQKVCSLGQNENEQKKVSKLLVLCKFRKSFNKSDNCNLLLPVIAAPSHFRREVKHNFSRYKLSCQTIRQASFELHGGILFIKSWLELLNFFNTSYWAGKEHKKQRQILGWWKCKHIVNSSFN